MPHSFPLVLITLFGGGGGVGVPSGSFGKNKLFFKKSHYQSSKKENTQQCFFLQSFQQTRDMKQQCHAGNRYLAVSQQRSGNTQQLSLSHREVLSVLRHLRVEGVRHLADLRRFGGSGAHTHFNRTAGGGGEIKGGGVLLFCTATQLSMLSSLIYNIHRMAFQSYRRPLRLRIHPPCL